MGGDWRNSIAASRRSSNCLHREHTRSCDSVDCIQIKVNKFIDTNVHSHPSTRYWHRQWTHRLPSTRYVVGMPSLYQLFAICYYRHSHSNYLNSLPTVNYLHYNHCASLTMIVIIAINHNRRRMLDSLVYLQQLK